MRVPVLKRAHTNTNLINRHFVAIASRREAEDVCASKLKRPWLDFCGPVMPIVIVSEVTTDTTDILLRWICNELK